MRAGVQAMPKISRRRLGNTGGDGDERS